MSLQGHARSNGDRCLALLADRDRDSLDMYAEYLRVSAYDVQMAVDGREALAKAISHRPEIVITEIQLPGIDGLHLCELLRGDVATQHTPIIVVTADVFPADAARALRAGANVVLPKPCLPDRLLAEIRACLATSRHLTNRAQAARRNAEMQVARATVEMDKARIIRTRVPLSKSFNRQTTAWPPLTPPSLLCPVCDGPLLYEKSHVGGVSERHREQWDYFLCPKKCGRFQYRHRSRKLRRIA